MLNTLWSADISVKEELKEDALASPDSPFHCSPDQAPRGFTEYHKLSPAPDSTQSHYYLAGVDSDNNHLGALLPAFHNLQPEPESPESRLAGAIEFPALGLPELSSPDSSQPLYPGLSTPHGLSLTSGARAQGPASRKRSNSGSSGSSAHSGSCSAGSGQSRPKIRRRQPLSQDELNSQRNQGKVKKDDATILIFIMLFSQRTRKAENTELERCLYKATGNCTDPAIRQTVKTRNSEVGAHVHRLS